MLFCLRAVRKLVRLGVCCGSVSALLTGAVAVAQSRTVSADWNATAGPHPASPLLVVGAGRANEGLRGDWQQQLSLVQQDIGFHYLRMHAILSDDMGLYSETHDGKPVYNFQYIDTLYDALLARHIRPFVELSFMPSALASGPQTIFWWHGNVTPPRDPAKWSALMHALIAHWRDRYGADEINQWYFEVWNEPDLKGFFTGSLQDYLNLYQNTAEAIRAECPKCRVGGPASASPYAYEQAFVAYCAAHHLPVDFVSTHSYGVEQGFLDATGTTGTRLSPNPHAVSERMRHSRMLLDSSALPHLQLHFTEWSSAYTATDPLHDQYQQAPFVLEQIRNAAGAVDSMSYWTFTDIFEENGPPKTPYHGGFGLLNYEGIPKPAFFAYEYLARLGNTDLKVKDSSATGPHNWVTRSADGQMAALLWDDSPELPPAGQNDQEFYKHAVPAHALPPLAFSVQHLPSGDYTLSVYRTGYHHNDAYDAYLEMGAPSQITRQQVADLKAVASGAPIEQEQVKIDSSGSFQKSLPFASNDVYLVLLTPKHP
jgi:xylan 1,4-beta-xylosidase